MSHSATHDMFGKSAQAPHTKEALNEHDEIARALREAFVSSQKIGVDIAEKKIVTQRRTRVSTCGAICGYLLVVVFVLWLAFSTRSRIAARSAALYVERTCVQMNRLKVSPITPAIDSRPGGLMEPFMFGTLTFSLEREEVSWQLSDSLGIEPYKLMIRGPQPSSGKAAPVFVELGLQRDSLMRLAGAARMSQEKILQLRSQPSLFYISVDEKLSGGRVRELVRDWLNKTCVLGMK